MTLRPRRRCRPLGRAYPRPSVFDSLSEKLQATLGDVRQRGTLTEDDINAAMREIRLALLEADVNFKVVQGVHRGGEGARAGRRRARRARTPASRWSRSSPRSSPS